MFLYHTYIWNHMVFVKSPFTSGLFLPTLRTANFRISRISASWKLSCTEGTRTIPLQGM